MWRGHDHRSPINLTLSTFLSNQNISGFHNIQAKGESVCEEQAVFVGVTQLVLQNIRVCVCVCVCQRFTPLHG